MLIVPVSFLFGGAREGKRLFDLQRRLRREAGGIDAQIARRHHPIARRHHLIARRRRLVAQRRHQNCRTTPPNNAIQWELIGRRYRSALDTPHPVVAVSQINQQGTVEQRHPERGAHVNQGRWEEAEKLGVQVMDAPKTKLGPIMSGPGAGPREG